MTNIAEAAPLAHLHRLDDASRAALFTDAHTANSFADVAVSEAELRSVWDLAKWAPTSANFQPMRTLFVQSVEGRERLVEHMSEGNKAKTLAAPAVAVLAYDRGFHEHLPVTTPHLTGLPDFFAENEGPRLDAARNNGWLQAGYFVLAVRAEGLAAGPMGGFDSAAVDNEFFPGGDWGSFLVINIGHPTEGSYRDRLPRLEHENVLRWA
jgi:3-hydroxypropanoate dehydrogenase